MEAKSETTFEQWWNATYAGKLGSLMPIELAFKEVAEKAWNAGKGENMPKLDDAVERIAELEMQKELLLKALEPFAALLQKHHERFVDDRPVFGINSVMITVNDLREAARLLKNLRG